LFKERGLTKNERSRDNVPRNRLPLFNCQRDILDVRRDRHTRYEQTDYERRNVVICIASATVEVIGGRGYRLPTEAEWEYACRAGTTTPFSFGGVLNGRQANCDGRGWPYGTEEKGPFLGRTARVGSYRPNAFGLYDMHGNVAEWCADYYDRWFYARSSVDDPTGPPSGNRWEDPVVRGGSFAGAPEQLRSADRSWMLPGSRDAGTGFRVARDYSEESMTTPVSPPVPAASGK
jgi:formylglycine-generating enzyme required for sulfatase activity